MPRYDFGAFAECRRVFPGLKPLTDAEQAQLAALEEQYEVLSVAESEEDSVEAGRLDAAIEALAGGEAFDAETIAQGGAIVTVGHNGDLYIGRGYIKPEDDLRRTRAKPAAAKDQPRYLKNWWLSSQPALRNALAQHGQTALLVLLHNLAGQVFYRYEDNITCLNIRLKETVLAQHAPDIAENSAEREIGQRQAGWLKRMPDDAGKLGVFLGSLTLAEQSELLAHCVWVAVCATSNLADSIAAVASPWEKLPDGRVVIQVKNVRLAFPADGADASEIEFADRHWIKNRMALKAIIAEPEMAQKFFSNASLIYVSIPNLRDRRGLYLEQFPRADFRSFEAGLAIGEGALANCEGWATRFASLKTSIASDDTRIRASVWAEFEESKNPLLLAYVLPPLDPNQLSFFPGISCDYFSICGSNKCVGADVSVSYRFSGKVIRQENWRSLELGAYEVFKHLLINLVK